MINKTMEFKTFLEVMAGEQDNKLNLTRSQKRVLRKSLEAQEPRMAAIQVLNAEDSRNLIAASKVLVKYGYITTTPPELGPEDEPESIEVTELGQHAADDYELMNDESLVTQKEKEESEPQGEQPSVDAQQAGAAGEEDLGGEEGLGGEELGSEGGDVSLELSSFFRDINDLAKLKG